MCVLMYHRVTKSGSPFGGIPRDQFTQQMRWLRQNCSPISPEDLASAVRETPQSKPRVLVTFDDGYRDYAEQAYPVLAELKIPALVFLATSFLDNGGLIWTDAITWAVKTSPTPSVDLPWETQTRLPLRDLADRDRAVRICKQHLKGVPDALREERMQELFRRLRVDPQDGSVDRQMLSWDEVRATLGLTRFGGHTHTHPILSQVDSERAEREISVSYRRIAEETGTAPRYFAYPNGREQDFTAQTKELLRRQGYELAFSTIAGLHVPGADPYAIRRQPAGGSSIRDFAWLVTGRGA